MASSATTPSTGKKGASTIELTQADIGEFEAEKIESVSSKKLVHLKGYVMPTRRRALCSLADR